jgi:hypothetical protein
MGFQHPLQHHSHVYFHPIILSSASVILIRYVSDFFDVIVQVRVTINLISLVIFLYCH